MSRSAVRRTQAYDWTKEKDEFGLFSTAGTPLPEYGGFVCCHTGSKRVSHYPPLGMQTTKYRLSSPDDGIRIGGRRIPLLELDQWRSSVNIAYMVSVGITCRSLPDEAGGQWIEVGVFHSHPSASHLSGPDGDLGAAAFHGYPVFMANTAGKVEVALPTAVRLTLPSGEVANRTFGVGHSINTRENNRLDVISALPSLDSQVRAHADILLRARGQ
jgi:hypothetical protein